MIDDYLEFKVSGPQGEYIPVEIFKKMVNGMNVVVDEVDRELSEDGRKSYSWRVTDLRMSSNIMAQACGPIRPNIDPTFNLSRYIREGLTAIQARQPQRPRGFNDKALRAFRGVLVAIAEPYKLRIANQDDFIIPNAESIAQIDSWLEGQYEAVGSIEGRLENVVTHDKLQCVIFDRLERRIECSFGSDLKQQIKEGLYEQVAVRGWITYRIDGVPVSARITRIQNLRSSSRPIKDLVGTWDLNMSSAEYLETLHGE